MVPSDIPAQSTSKRPTAPIYSSACMPQEFNNCRQPVFHYGIMTFMIILLPTNSFARARFKIN